MVNIFVLTDFSAVFSAFYAQRSVTATWATPSPWSILKHSLLLRMRRNMDFLLQKILRSRIITGTDKELLMLCHLQYAGLLRHGIILKRASNKFMKYCVNFQDFVAIYIEILEKGLCKADFADFDCVN